ncbi:hypothetical protein [Flexivirga meconopsidis]|uniref:hypothetical protein n=1 Tax=Flexivirga meconopsidis TaxID=2977121 RepID=UPI00223FAF8F|nr:hypothetical protein [Flexivirga meconopsidis]
MEQLVVGGSADSLWPAGTTVAGQTMYVEGADHVMHRGGLRESAGLHVDVAERVVEFAKQLG